MEIALDNDVNKVIASRFRPSGDLVEQIILFRLWIMPLKVIAVCFWQPDQEQIAVFWTRATVVERSLD